VSTDSDLLRQIAGAPAQLAMQAGAVALDDNPRLLATIAGLEHSLEVALARIAELERVTPLTHTVVAGDTLTKIGAKYGIDWHLIQQWNRLTSTTLRVGQVLRLTAPDPAHDEPRFPGDPGVGRILLGVATHGGALGRVTEHENAVHKRLVRRRYWNDGVGDLNAAVRFGITDDHRAGRIPCVSIKPGPFGTIASSSAAQDALRSFVVWAERQPLPIFFVVDHEPENNLKGQPADAQHAGASKFRADQQKIREIITEVTAGKPHRISFGGSLMGWNWAAAAHAGPEPILALPDEWFPGAGVWDWCGLDQYAQKSGTTILDTKWKGAVTSLARWGVPLAVTELGIRSADPAAGRRLKDFIEAAIAAGSVMVLYYDSDSNSTGEGWVLDDRGGQLSAWRDLFADPRIANPAA
jgi:LysM repeat protein